MKSYADYRKNGIISVWIGDFSSEEELDDYLNLRRDFEKDFQFELLERDMPETTVEKAPVSIADLADGFSWSESFRDDIVRLAERQGITEATTLVVFYNLEYIPERANPPAPLKFLGTTPFGR